MINKFSILNDSKYFSSGILQIYLLFIPTKNTLNILVALVKLVRRNLIECQKKILKNITKSDSKFAPTFFDHHVLPDINFNGHCLIKSNISIPKKLMQLYISYTLSPRLRNVNTDFTLNNCLFESVELTKNADPYK